MKIISQWDSLESQNRHFKYIVIFLLVLCLLLTIAITAKIREPPLVVERSCTTQIIKAARTQPTADEIKTFTELAIHQRFDSKSQDTSFLTSTQRSYRSAEQDDLSKQKMRQSVLVNHIDLLKDSISVEADRVIAIGNIRSGFRFNLKITLVPSQRSERNPYGLLLETSELIRDEVKK
jgi:hypothetical protein